MAYHPGVGVFKFGDWRPHISKLSVNYDRKQIDIDDSPQSVYNRIRTLVR